MLGLRLALVAQNATFSVVSILIWYLPSHTLIRYATLKLGRRHY